MDLGTFLKLVRDFQKGFSMQSLLKEEITIILNKGKPTKVYLYLELVGSMGMGTSVPILMGSRQQLLSRLTAHCRPAPTAQVIASSLVRAVQCKPLLMEWKCCFNQKPQPFPLENWVHSETLCVGRWLPSEENNYNMPLGSFSWGVWWKDEPVGAYRLHDPYGNLIAYRLDVLKDVRMMKIDSNDLIQFSDLVVDLWLWPNEEGQVSPADVQVEDLEELEALKKAGSISLEDSKVIDRVVKDVKDHPQRVVDLVDRSILTAIRNAEESLVRSE
jgi:hypothetical protein